MLSEEDQCWTFKLLRYALTDTVDGSMLLGSFRKLDSECCGQYSNREHEDK